MLAGYVPTPTDLSVGYVAGITPRTANSAGILATETVIDTFTFTAVAGRRYRAVWDGVVSNNAATNNVEMHLRYAAGASVTNTGTLIAGKLHTSPAANINMPTTITLPYSGFPAGQVTIGFFLVTSFGSGTSTAVAGVNYPTNFWIEDIGT